MHLRRVLLLFALVLAVSALVASFASPPREQEQPQPPAEPRTPPASVSPVTTGRSVRFAAPADGRPPGATTPLRRAPVGSSIALEVAVPEPGEVTVEGLGLRQSADPRAPARFGLLAETAGRHTISFLPVRGEERTVGRLEFFERRRR